MNPRIVIDNCVLLNLLAGEILKDLTSSRCNFYTASLVLKKETKYLGKEKKPILSEDLNFIKPLEPNENEAEMIMKLSKLHKGDGEIHSIALAIGREYDLATDDSKAIRLYHQYNRSNNLWTTPGLVRLWSQNKTFEQIRNVIFSITETVKFRLKESHSDFKWWNEYL